MPGIPLLLVLTAAAHSTQKNNATPAFRRNTQPTHKKKCPQVTVTDESAKYHQTPWSTYVSVKIKKQHYTLFGPHTKDEAELTADEKSPVYYCWFVNIFKREWIPWYQQLPCYSARLRYMLQSVWKFLPCNVIVQFYIAWSDDGKWQWMFWKTLDLHNDTQQCVYMHIGAQVFVSSKIYHFHEP